MAPRKRSFLFDRMLGRLAVKMRMLGYDAKLSPDGETGRFLLNAEREGRTAVTRSRVLGDRPGPRPVVLRAGDTLDQLAELFDAIAEPPSIEPFTRCLECNAALVAVAAGDVRGAVPAHVERTFTEFHRCPSCGRVYWKGTHFEAMSEEVRRIETRLATIRRPPRG